MSADKRADVPPREPMSALILYGSPLSNFYNKIKIALLELKLPFTEQAHLPHSGHWPDSGSPSGKIPFLHTPDGTLYESQAILEYLEDISPSASGYPASAPARAHCRELICYLENYLEAAARPLYGAAYWGRPSDEPLHRTACESITAALVPLARRVRLSPWICGSEYSHADGTAWVHVNTVARALQVLGLPPLVHEALPQLATWQTRAAERPSIRQIESDRREAAKRLRR